MRRSGLYEWLRARPYILDVSLVAALVLASAPPMIGGFWQGNFAEPIVIAGLTLPLIWRRRRPVEVFTVVSFACFLQLFVFGSLIPADVGFLLALYAISAYGRSRWARYLALATGALGAVLGALCFSGGLSLGRDVLLRSMGILFVVVALTWTLGDLMRTRRAYVEQLEERTRRLEFERGQEALLARSAERARIAREMHDVVAHSLSIVVAQADGGRYAGETDPKQAQAALDTIARTGRQALTEMRKLLGVLRSKDSSDAPEFTPQPGLDDISRLIDGVRDSGLPVSLQIEGSQGMLPGGVELALYRIVQEALTNTLKHGGPSVEASILLSYGKELVRVTVTDNGRGVSSATSDGQGHGLEGMRERAAVYGGTLHSGPRPGGGFRVVAEIPVTALPVDAALPADTELPVDTALPIDTAWPTGTELPVDERADQT